MLDQILSTLAAYAANAGEAFLLPGEILLRGVAAVSPQTAEVLTHGTGGTIVKFILALMTWTLLTTMGLLLLNACKRIARQVSALFHIFLWRARMYIGNLKTRLIWKYRQYFPYKSAGAAQLAQTDFDATDIAVLLTIARRGPGMALSAPDICGALDLRPAQVQARLEQLQHFKMVCSVLGTTDGFENYALTDSGQTYLAMMRRQAKKSPPVSEASPARSY